jgi:hypothetical protein
VQYQNYTYNNAIPGDSGGPVNNQQFPSTSLLGAFVSRLPYAYQIIDSMIQRNPKFYDFKGVSPKREEMIQDQSVFLHDPMGAGINDSSAPGNILINKDYQAFIYANVDKDKTRRVSDYRRMAAYAELADCLDEICDECIVKDENDIIVNFQLRGEYTKEIKDLIEKEFQKFVVIFDLEDSGWEYFRQFLIEGEMFFENIIDSRRPELGIIGLVSIPTELINPVYSNVQNELIKGFMLRKPVNAPTTSVNKKDQEELFFMQKAQVTYVHSGIWNEFKTLRLPYIENAKRAYRQLSLIEDSIVIYRMVRAPERLKFKIYTGGMPAPKAEAYMKRMMQQWWSKKNYDTTQSKSGQVTNLYDPQSMLDSYWFPVDAQGKGSDVEMMPGGANLGEMKDLEYFLKKLYNSLKIPTSRFLVADTPFKDGTEITRDELRFARFVIRLQRQFATSIRDSFIAHLKLKNFWKQYKLKERAMHVEFNIPTSFMAMREQQLLELKFNNFNQATQNPSIAPSYAQKYYLGLNDDMMKENREWLRKDSALKWELAQIESMGPNFREQLAAQAGITPGAEGGALPAGGGGGGGGGGIPEFGGGETPEVGGEAEPESIGGPAPGVGATSPPPPTAGAPENTQGLAPTQGSPEAQQAQT